MMKTALFDSGDMLLEVNLKTWSVTLLPGLTKSSVKIEACKKIELSDILRTHTNTHRDY